MTPKKHISLDWLQRVKRDLLGAPRTTVTMAAGILHKAGMIDYSRGVVTIKDHPLLEKSACECYAIVRDGFQRFSLL